MNNGNNGRTGQHLEQAAPRQHLSSSCAGSISSRQYLHGFQGELQTLSCACACVMCVGGHSLQLTTSRGRALSLHLSFYHPPPPCLPRHLQRGPDSAPRAHRTERRDTVRAPGALGSAHPARILALLPAPPPQEATPTLLCGMSSSRAPCYTLPRSPSLPCASTAREIGRWPPGRGPAHPAQPRARAQPGLVLTPPLPPKKKRVGGRKQAKGRKERPGGKARPARPGIIGQRHCQRSAVSDRVSIQGQHSRLGVPTACVPAGRESKGATDVGVSGAGSKSARAKDVSSRTHLESSGQCRAVRRRRPARTSPRGP